MREIDTYLCPDWNSLLFNLISLLSKYFSLLIQVGNLVRSGCGEGLFAAKTCREPPNTQKYPVIFPVIPRLLENPRNA
jgi:hypothetical protein